MGESARKPIPIYSTSGDWCALMIFPYIFNTLGEWIGWVTSKQQVFSVLGIYVGWMTAEPRILRHRIPQGALVRKNPPPPPDRIRPPATVPLPPMMAELPFEIVDVFEEDTGLMHTLDHGEFKEDMD